jgi:hypothetical protein
MIVEKTKNEIVVRLSSDIDLSELQDMLDYLKFKELTSNVISDQTDADLIAEEANISIWGKYKRQKDKK